jgi:hypothetical protein
MGDAYIRPIVTKPDRRFKRGYRIDPLRPWIHLGEVDSATITFDTELDPLRPSHPVEDELVNAVASLEG